MKESVPMDAALRRYLDACRARETQTAVADEFAGEYARALGGANSQERHAAAVIVAEAYEEACSLFQIELDLMVAARVIRVSDSTERQMDIQVSIEGGEMFALPGDYVQAAAHWRDVAEIEKAIHLQETQANRWRADSGNILDAIVSEGRCGTCGTPWDRVVKVDGQRPVKVEGGCPNEVCVLGDW